MRCWWWSESRGRTLLKASRRTALDAVQGAEGITRFGRARRGCNQRLHRNPATLVTPTVRFPVPNYFTTNNER